MRKTHSISNDRQYLFGLGDARSDVASPPWQCDILGARWLSLICAVARFGPLKAINYIISRPASQRAVGTRHRLADASHESRPSPTTAHRSQGCPTPRCRKQPVARNGSDCTTLLYRWSLYECISRHGYRGQTPCHRRPLVKPNSRPCPTNIICRGGHVITVQVPLSTPPIHLGTDSGQRYSSMGSRT